MKLFRWISLLLTCLFILSSCNVTDWLPEFNTTREETLPGETESPHTHEFGEWEMTQAPTCEADGQENRVCACGEIESRPVEKAAHQWSLQNQCTFCKQVINANILILESIQGESADLCNIIGEKHTVTVMNIQDTANLPTSAQALGEYDEIILVNVSNDDMAEGFDVILHRYVTERGGSLLTVGGNEPDSDPLDGQWNANAYTWSDMYGTLYQELLPVEISGNTPATAVVFILDTSASMTYNNGTNLYEGSGLYWAEQGVRDAIGELSEKDYVGILTFADSYDYFLPLTSMTQRNMILSRLNEIDEYGGNGIISPSLAMAGQMLRAMPDDVNKHIVLLTDGSFQNQDMEEAAFLIQSNNEAGITMSVVGMNCSMAEENTLRVLFSNAITGNTKGYYSAINYADAPALALQCIRSLLYTEVTYQKFVPTVGTVTPVVEQIDPSTIPMLSGYYSSTLKEGATVVLKYNDAPIYAVWCFGNGTVGSFMCDLNGTWSSSFLSSDTGKTILWNIISDLLNARHGGSAAK